MGDDEVGVADQRDQEDPLGAVQLAILAASAYLFRGKLRYTVAKLVCGYPSAIPHMEP